MIDNSQMWRYWPSVYWEQWGAPRVTFDEYTDVYEGIWNSFGGINQDGENVTREEINAQIVEVGGTSYRVPEGYLRTDSSGLLELLGATSETLSPLEEDEPTGHTQLACRLRGYIAWQCYRLELAMQGSKLTQFGRRGPQ